ncbi:hypothetical protein BD769DRAFT_1388147 [Suillus cothurnatus]|nr:hypothetical protein BD769DRAFT_1388147 [Suillus cothurnatus]
MHGLSVLLTSWGSTHPHWRLTLPFSGGLKKMKRNQQESQIDTEVEADTAADSDDEDDGEAVKILDEKNWECLLRTIHYNMHNQVKAKSTLLPFHTVPESQCHQFQKTQFSAYGLKKCNQNEKSWSDILTGVEITISDLAEDIPIFLGIATKGYLIIHEQPWHHFILLFSIANKKCCAHYLDHSEIIISAPIFIDLDPVHFIDVLNTMTLESHSALSLDPTIHVCNSLCQGTPHNNIPGGVDDIPTGAIGWVIDDIGEHKNTKEEFALKDCWVDIDSLNHKVEFLQAVDSVPNMVQLVKYWDAEFLLTTFKSVPELVNVFLTLWLMPVAHKTLMFEQEVLHGDLSPNNIIIYEGKG